MTSELLEPLSPALRDAALLNLGWQPDHVVIDASTGPLPTDWPAASADWITFFGPFVHLTDPEIFHCWEVAKPALKPDGRLVFTFLDYDVPAHWRIFRDAANCPPPAQPAGDSDPAPEAGEGQLAPSASREQLAPPHFLNRATVEAWALHLGLSLEYHYSGEVNWLQPLQSGAVEAIGLGPSLIVLTPLAEHG